VAENAARPGAEEHGARLCAWHYYISGAYCYNPAIEAVKKRIQIHAFGRILIENARIRGCRTGGYMGKKQPASRLFVAVLASVLSLARAQGPDATLEEQLQSKYRTTSLTADNSDIVTAGTVLILRRGGFSAGAVSSRVPTRNTYKDGQIKAEIPGILKNCSFCSAIPGGSKVNSAISAAGPSREFVAGERLYVTKMSVDRAKDVIIFNLISDPYGNEGRYKGSLTFQYPKGSIGSANLGQVEPLIAEVFRNTDPQYVSSAPQQGSEPQPTVAQAPRPMQTSPEQPDAPLPPLDIPVAPDPDAPAPVVETRVIAAGQTREQVTAILGEPLTSSKFGNEEICQFKSVKVTFVNGRLTDVE
jgi:hypothetical protein